MSIFRWFNFLKAVVDGLLPQKMYCRGYLEIHWTKGLFRTELGHIVFTGRRKGSANGAHTVDV